LKRSDQLLAEVAAGGVLSPRLSDALSASGELLSSTVVAAAFRGEGLAGRWVDIRPAMLTNDDHTRATVQFDQANPRLKTLFTAALEGDGVPVTQGLSDRPSMDVTTTIGRGGSDYSASIIGAALDAEEIQIWTDVDGIMSTDPRIVPEAVKVRTISFAEASNWPISGRRYCIRVRCCRRWQKIYRFWSAIRDDRKSRGRRSFVMRRHRVRWSRRLRSNVESRSSMSALIAC
jgi:aspartate kinase